MKTVSEHRTLRGGGYHAIHKWLVKHFGSAQLCEGEQCNGKSKLYHWAKLNDREYEHKRENFIQLCSSCHRKYDMTDDLKLTMSQSKRTGRKGVYYNTKRTSPKKWMAMFSYMGKKYHAGYFEKQEEARLAYEKLYKEIVCE